MQEEIKNILKCLEMDMLDNKQIEKLLDYITNLQEENEKLTAESTEWESKYYKFQNIIDEFDKWLIGEKMMFYKSDDGERLIRFGETKNKWLELKGDNK